MKTPELLVMTRWEVKFKEFKDGCMSGGVVSAPTFFEAVEKAKELWPHKEIIGISYLCY